MCRYEYSSYGACGHSVIECREVCGVTLWRAGVTGDLILCVPEILGRSLQWSGPKEDEPPQIISFVGFNGYCDACVKESEIQDNSLERNDCFDYFTNPQEHDPQGAAPHFQVDQLLTTFPHLLAIDQQLTEANMDLGPVVLFPEALKKLTWADLRQQQPYKVLGFWMTDAGVETVTDILNNLHCTSGTSPQDRSIFLHVVKHKLNMNDLYNDVFKSRGMPYPIFSRLYAQIKGKATICRREHEQTTAAPANPRPTTSVQPSRPQPLNDHFQDGSPSGARQAYVRSDDEQSAPEIHLAQGSRVVQSFPDTDSRALSGVSESAVKTRLEHQDKSSQASQGRRGTKRLFSSVQEEGSQSTGSSISPHQSHLGQETTERPAQRSRYSQTVVPSPLSPDVSQGQPSTTAPPSQLVMPTAGRPSPAINGSPRASPSTQAMAIPQQPGVQRQVGQFDSARCRDMQAQARAAQAVPLQPPSTEVLQAQAEMLQAAQARAAQPLPPPSQVQLVDASQAQALQAQYRRAHAPSEIEANQNRAAKFEAGFNKAVQSQGLSVPQAQAGVFLPPEQVQEQHENEARSNSLLTLQSPAQDSLIDQPPAIQSAVTSPSVQQSLIDQSTINPSLFQQSPATESTATPSPTSQPITQANTEDIPGKGKGVLPHVVAKATFFLNDQEKDNAISYLTRAWTAYRKQSEGSAGNQRAASWIINFTLNFRRHWVLSSRSGGALRSVTSAQLMQAQSGARSKNPRSSASVRGVAQSQVCQGQKVADNQAAQQQDKPCVTQTQDTTPSYSPVPGAYAGQSQLPVQCEEPATSFLGSGAGDAINGHTGDVLGL